MDINNFKFKKMIEKKFLVGLSFQNDKFWACTEYQKKVLDPNLSMVVEPVLDFESKLNFFTLDKAMNDVQIQHVTQAESLSLNDYFFCKNKISKNEIKLYDNEYFIFHVRINRRETVSTTLHLDRGKWRSGLAEFSGLDQDKKETPWRRNRMYVYLKNVKAKN